MLTTDESVASAVGVHDLLLWQFYDRILRHRAVLGHDHGLTALRYDDDSFPLVVDLLHLRDLERDLLSVRRREVVHPRERVRFGFVAEQYVHVRQGGQHRFLEVLAEKWCTEIHRKHLVVLVSVFGHCLNGVWTDRQEESLERRAHDFNKDPQTRLERSEIWCIYIYLF